jgi:hypothetical protein
MLHIMLSLPSHASLLYAMSRRCIVPSISRLAMKATAVVAIGVVRRSVGRDNGVR